MTNSIPDGWLLCDGHRELISEYKELYDTIGLTYTYDEEGEEYFRVPDLRGRFIRGFDYSGEVDKGRIFGDLQDDALQNHLHMLDISQIKISEFYDLEVSSLFKMNFFIFRRTIKGL